MAIEQPLLEGNSSGSEFNLSRWVPLVLMLGWIMFSVCKGWRHDASIEQLRRDVEEIKARQVLESHHRR